VKKTIVAKALCTIIKEINTNGKDYFEYSNKDVSLP
jgi:hypothetical protein